MLKYSILGSIFGWSVIALCGTSIAHAGSNVGGEFSLEIGHLDNADPHYDIFSNENGMVSVGVRGGVRFLDRLTILAGWHHSQKGGEVVVGNYYDEPYYYDDYYWEDEPSYQGVIMHSLLTTDTYALGVKGDVDVKGLFYPYATVQAVLVRSVMQLDDNPDEDDNPGQVMAGSVAPGGLFMGGFEFAIPQGNMPLTVKAYFEAGYGLVGALDFGEYGSMQPGGFVMRTGIGVRF